MIPKDKLQHFLLGALVAVVVFALTQSALWASVSGILVGFVTELWDGFSKKGTVDELDFVATAAGSILAALGLVILFT